MTARIALRVGLGLLVALATVTPLRGQAVDAADSAWVRGDRSTAELLYGQRLAVDSTDAPALFRMALMAGWHGRRIESLALLDRLLALWPGDNDARVAKVRQFSALGRHHEAAATVDTILEINPDDIGGLQARARLTGYDGDLVESERLWRSVLEREPGNTETRLGLSQVLRRQGRAAAAAAILAPVSGRAHLDSDLRDELDRVAVSMDPRTRARLIREDDSDGNAISTLALHAASRAAPRVEVRADAWFRAASLDGSNADVNAQGGTLTAWSQFESGWSLYAGAGVARVGRPDIDATAVWTLGVGSPGRHRWSATATASRQALDYTAPMAANGIRMNDVEVTAVGRPARNVTIDAAVSTGSFESQRSGLRNRRTKGRVSLARAMSDVVSLAVQASGFGFEKDTNDGYFDPDLYGIGAIELRWRRETRQWTVVGTVAPGLQKIGSAASVSGAMHVQAGFALTPQPGRSIGLNAVWANTGMQQLSARPAGSYRYASIGLDFQWRFR